MRELAKSPSRQENISRLSFRRRLDAHSLAKLTVKTLIILSTQRAKNLSKNKILR